MSDLDQLAADLLQAAQTVAREAPDVVSFAAARTAEAARAAAPVRTGALQRSITTRATLGGLSTVVEAGAAHAAFVEYGTSKMPPQPFMRPAADAAEADFMKAMEALGGDVL